jgi:hypothetical protein
MTTHRGGEPANPARRGAAEAHPSQEHTTAAPYPLAWLPIAVKAWRITCAHCGTELVYATPDLPRGLNLAARNACARPCCPAWRDQTPPSEAG